MMKLIFLILLLLPVSQFAFAENIPDYNKPYVTNGIKCPKCTTDTKDWR